MKAGVPLLLVLLLTGCASVVPEELASTVNRQVSGADLIRDPERYRGQTVVLGGEILQVRNSGGEAEVEVLERPLSFEEPVLGDQSAGRFLVRHAGFLDPAVYAVGRRVTVVGAVVGQVERKMGDVDYRYPVVESRRLKLWPLETAGPYYRYAPYTMYPPYYRYDPFWGPFWYGPYWDPFWFRAHRFRR